MNYWAYCKVIVFKSLWGYTNLAYEGDVSKTKGVLCQSLSREKEIECFKIRLI